MPTNDDLADAAIRHAIWISRYGGTVARKLVGILEEVDRDLEAKLYARLDRLGPLDRQELGRGKWTTRRLKLLRDQLRQQIVDIRTALGESLSGEMSELVETEVDIASRRLVEAIGFDLEILRPAPELVRAAADPIISGRPLHEWVSRLARERAEDVARQVAWGVLQGETTPQLAARISERLGFQRRAANTLARTATNAVANKARSILYAENDDVIKSEIFLSVLDGRTSPKCRALSRQEFPVGEGPQPPLHPMCRSVRSPRTYSFEELAKPGALKRGRGSTNIDSLFRDALRRQGFTETEIGRIKRNQQASMDGQVPRDLTYSDWLRRQPAEFQDDVLGRTKGKLFRAGKVDLDRFVELPTGREFTLEELRKRESKAWAKAGLPTEGPAVAREAS